jgi:hypothetical protein
MRRRVRPGFSILGRAARVVFTDPTLGRADRTLVLEPSDMERYHSEKPELGFKRK